MKRKKWVVSQTDKDFAVRVSDELGVDALSALIATSRGIDSIEKMEAFFDEDALLTLDPMSIKDMDKASDRINAAIDSFELICVYGDYDCDGVTSTALLYSYLLSAGANVMFYIPDRVNEGYGLNEEAVRKLAEKGVKLLVTVDNGITANKDIELAYSLGMQVVVTDHHKPGNELPVCEAVVDLHREDCESRFKEMSGVGVAFKLVCALSECDDVLYEYADLITIGTIGDVVALTDENRIMVRAGVKMINECPSVGISALLKVAGAEGKPVTSTSVAFLICPRINAAGRMGSAERALSLLLCEDEEKAMAIATEINDDNAARQKTEADIFADAKLLIEKNPHFVRDRVLVVAGEGWHKGVLGIAAARMAEYYGKPSIVISIDGEDACGSCRSIEGFSVYDALDAVSDCLDHFGGHTLAAGVSLKTDNIDLFRDKINEYAAKVQIPYVIQKIDCKINPASVNTELLSSLSFLEPFGSSNPQPVFGLFSVRLDDFSPVSEGKHTRLSVSKNGSRLNCVCFGMNTARFPFSKGDIVDLAVNLEKNVYNGETRVSVIVRNIRFSSLNEDFVLRNMKIYEDFERGETLSSAAASYILPDRETQAGVFKAVKCQPLTGNDCEALCVRFGDNGKNYAKYRFTLDVMLEMGVLELNENGAVSVPSVTQKVSFDDSELMQRLKNCI